MTDHVPPSRQTAALSPDAVATCAVPDVDRRALRQAGDRGAASIYAAAIGLVLVLVGLGIALQAARLVAGAQAQTAADLGALAGAMRGPFGRDTACVRAADIATRNGATTISCSLDGLDLTLTVEVRGVESTSRAGPIRSDSKGGDDD